MTDLNILCCINAKIKVLLFESITLLGTLFCLLLKKYIKINIGNC